MPSDKNNSRIYGFDSFTNQCHFVPRCAFHQPQQLQCLHHGATFVPSSQPLKVTICSRHVMASLRVIKIVEALLILFLAYFVMKQVRHCWNWGVIVFMYRDMGRKFHECILHIFHNGWMDCRDAFHVVVSLHCCVTDRYKVYRLMGVQIINPGGRRQPFLLVKQYTRDNQPKLIL